LANHDFQAGLRLLRRPDIGKLFVAYLITYIGTTILLTLAVLCVRDVREMTGSD